MKKNIRKLLPYIIHWNNLAELKLAAKSINLYQKLEEN
jgi:hypothetical protein